MKKKVIINSGCIGCGLCQALAPEVFEVKDVSHVKEDVDLKNYESEIKEAVDSCPVQVIAYENEE